MDLGLTEIDHEFLPIVRVYKDGKVERLISDDVVPPSLHSHTSVSSKDIVLAPETGVSARLYLPNNISPNQKLPLLIYYHGGGFIVGTAFSRTYHDYLNSLVFEANVVAISVDYRRAPEHPVPTAYEDSWAALQWVASHSGDDGPEAWLRDHSDFGRVILAGDSAGANIVHSMAMRAGRTQLPGGVKLRSVVLVHPYFWGDERIGSETTKDPSKTELFKKLWRYVCPTAVDNEDPCINPVAAGAPSLSGLGCTRLLVCVAGKDVLRDRGWLYYETLAKSGWDGVVEIMETEGEDHVFHLFNPTSDKAVDMMKRVVSFMNQN